jgi:hypothetical protein
MTRRYRRYLRVGLPVVYLRPTAFFGGMFLVQAAKGIRDDSVIRLPFAAGKTALQLVGRTPIAAAEFARRHAAAFTPAGRSPAAQSG